MLQPCAIIGVLDDGFESLNNEALRLLREADCVIGGGRTLELCASLIQTHAERLDLTGNLKRVPEWINNALLEDKRVVVLATGDPLCHGIASFLIGKLEPEALKIIPNVSTMQLACAKLYQPWNDLHICSVHSIDAGDWVLNSDAQHGLYALLQSLLQFNLIGVFTSPENNPNRIARMLMLESLQDQFEMAIAECMHQAKERIASWMNIQTVLEREYFNPNIVLLRRIKPLVKLPLFGLQDDRFIQRKPEKGLITKREIRAVSLARLSLRIDSIVWDIGAGSGSVGLEAARLCFKGHVYAIEKNEADYNNAWQNRLNLGITNYTLLHGKAPLGLNDWPDPDAVFIGGSGGELCELIDLSMQRLRSGGTLVMNFATFENLNLALECLKQMGAVWDIVQLQASRSQPILDMHRLQAENPIWIVSVVKP